MKKNQGLLEIKVYNIEYSQNRPKQLISTINYKCVDNYAGRAILKNVNVVMHKLQGHIIIILLHYIEF